MKLRFRESMYGTLRKETGRPLPFEFTVNVEARRLKDWLLARPLMMTGEVTLEGHAVAAPLEGTLRIGLPFDRRLEYAFTFRDRGGKLCRFYGEKKVYVTRFPSTMSTLKGQLFCDGVPLGEGILRFRWRDLPAFLGSFALSFG